jgi:regulator of protease activity HflC (stomatin/prohibitin superfamily)
VTYAALIQPVLWLIAGGTSAFFVSRAAWAWKKKEPRGRDFKFAVLSLLAAFIIVPAVAVVPAGSRGVVFRWDGGVSQTPLAEGVSFIVPWIQHVTTLSVRTQKVYSATVYSQSADLQEITVVASVNYHVDPSRAPYLYQRVGNNYASVVIQPALYQRTKAAVGQIQAITFALKRDVLVSRIEQQLKDQLSGYGIVVEYVNIEDAIFDPAFVASVKAKIIAKQFAQQQQNLVAAKRFIKQQTIINAQATARSVLIQATAQSKANRLLAASITDVLLRYKFFTTWNGILPQTLVGAGATGLSLFLSPSSGSTYQPYP